MEIFAQSVLRGIKTSFLWRVDILSVWAVQFKSKVTMGFALYAGWVSTECVPSSVELSVGQCILRSGTVTLTLLGLC